MTHSTVAPPTGPGTVRLNEYAARVLASELIRHGGPKTALLTDINVADPLLAVVLEAVRSTDSLVLIATDCPGGDAAALRAHLATLGSWLGDRVRVVETLS